eukprot:GFUD01044980.1.p1 GENE.GFUD01044980.1~~GFUD01044980.1.p1  ORF type:complete len:825 (-),score=220.37 GFUD01044980.1:214-2688(-)
MTAIVGMAMGKRDVPTELPSKEATTASFLLPGLAGKFGGGNSPTTSLGVTTTPESSSIVSRFYKTTWAIIGGLQTRAEQWRSKLTRDTDLVAKCIQTRAVQWRSKMTRDKDLVSKFICALYKQYLAVHFTYMEINMDAKTGASLKLTILNASGRIWTMVAGGGASVVYSDTNCALGDSSEVVGSSELAGKPGAGDDSPTSSPVVTTTTESSTASLFSKTTRAIIWGLQTKAVQGMMDFDYVCGREQPSVACMVYPMSPGDSKQNFYWGHKEVLVPIYKSMADAMAAFPDVDVLISFASLRSAYDSTLECLEFKQIRTIAIIAEGIPENYTRKLIKEADKKNVTIIGPATVGGVKPGCFRIGNTGGMLDNILHSKLYRPGNVAYVSRSGGMSNELNNMISQTTNGVYEGVAIGGDRYPCSTFMDHLLRYQASHEVGMLVLLGEVGGTEEYQVCEAIKSGVLTKPIVAWCIGACADMFPTDVQFGHAGASAGASEETASAKNKALAEAGAEVPTSFDELGEKIGEVYRKLVIAGTIVPKAELPPPPVPMDYNWARELGLIRKPASFMTSICDERGQELLYAGIPITEVFKQDLGIGGVLSLLWFQRRLPPYACKFLEMCLMITADHGPAVSGAHNTIVCARAGKDLVSSLVSGLLTIGDRFGGALDGAAAQFTEAFDSGLIANDFVNKAKKEGVLIMGIGHRVKSLNNPDMRVVVISEYAKEHFPCTPLLDYAREVEQITTKKKPNLILNVDGCIALCFVDLLRHSGFFTKDEAENIIKTGSLNGLFVLGRSIGFIGHFLDQKRLKQGLYRHPWDDISYVLPEINQ